MFGKFGDLLKMQQQAKQLQAQLEKEELAGTAAQDKVKITINGTNKTLRTEIDPSLLTPENKANLEFAITEASNNAREQIQQRMMQKMQGGELSLE